METGAAKVKLMTSVKAEVSLCNYLLFPPSRLLAAHLWVRIHTSQCLRANSPVKSATRISPWSKHSGLSSLFFLSRTHAAYTRGKLWGVHNGQSWLLLGSPEPSSGLSTASFPTRAQPDTCTLSLLRRRKKPRQLGLRGAGTSLTVLPPQIQKQVLPITTNMSF